MAVLLVQLLGVMQKPTKLYPSRFVTAPTPAEKFRLNGLESKDCVLKLRKGKLGYKPYGERLGPTSNNLTAILLAK